MRALIDTNIILDVLCQRERFFENSSMVFKLCEMKELDGVISALSIPNLVYIMRKELDHDAIKIVLQKLSLIFKIEDLKAADLLKAAVMDFKDYEDALQSVCAERTNADFIISRNVKDFQNSSVKAVTPEEFLNML